MPHAASPYGIRYDELTVQQRVLLSVNLYDGAISNKRVVNITTYLLNYLSQAFSRPSVVFAP